MDNLSVIIAPLPTIPSSSSIHISARPVFQWSSVQGATSYDLQVADNPTFEIPIDDLTRLNVTYWIETKPLEQGKTYYWRVRAVAADGNTHANWLSSYFTTVQ